MPEEIAPAFAKKHEVLFLRPNNSSGLIRKNKNFTILDIEAKGEDEVAIPSLNYTNINLIFRTLKKFSPHIIHAQDIGPVAFLLQIWAKENGVPFVYTSHILPTRFPKFGTAEISQQLTKVFDSNILRKYYAYFFKNCDAIVALNQSARKDLLKFGYRGKIFIVPNGRNLSMFSRLKLADISSRQKKLVFIGFLTQNKNQRYLLEMMRYLPQDYKLSLIGGPLSEEYFKEIKSYIAENNLAQVELLGKVPYEKIPCLLQESHVFVSASKMEVQSLVILEALAAGRPVVSLSNATTREFIDKSVGINFSQKTSPKVFAQGVKRICSLPPETYEKMCLAARAKVSHLDWSRIVDLTMEVYQKLIIQEKKKIYEDNEDILEKLSQIFDYQSLKRKISLQDDIYILLLAIITSVSGSFYSIVKTSQKLKTKPLRYLSQRAATFIKS